MRTLILLAVLTFFVATLKAQQWTGAGTNDITNTNSGNVGIGTITPQGKLVIAPGTLNSVANSKIRSLIFETGLGFNTSLLEVSAIRHTSGNDWLSATTRIQQTIDATPMAFIDFNPQNNSWGMALGTGGDQRMVINSSGNIGVGTSSPTAKLHVKGGQIIETEISGGTNTRTLTLLETGTGQIYFGAYSGSWRSSIQIQNNNATRGLFMAPPEADYGYSILRSISGGYKFDVGGNYADYGINAISIEESGNVKFPNSIGIGCDVQSTYKLAVNGDAIFTKVKVKQYSSWPDYVFSDDYKLPSLEEIRKYIQLNKHLPGVPSAKEVEENGLDLGNNQAILLKKVEELTLYLLDQDKKQVKQTEEFHALQQQLIRQQKEIEAMKQQLQTLLKK